jgi:replicative superfamily II helicase
VQDKVLALCLRGGVGFHTAGLCVTDRSCVEQLFLRRAIRLLCATSALAQGVNLPVSLVIGKGTKHYTENTLQEYDATQILQMAGRAGRPQFHDNGTCVIMPEARNVRKYEDIVNNTKPIESALMENLAEYLNAEVALGFVGNRSDVIRWLRSTYLYIQGQQNPLFYRVTDSRTVSQFLQDLCMRHLEELRTQQLIKIGDDGELISLSAESICSQYGVMNHTIIAFLKSPPPPDLRSTLALLATAGEFADCIVQQEEKHRMRMMSVDPAFRFGDHSRDDGTGIPTIGVLRRNSHASNGLLIV